MHSNRELHFVQKPLLLAMILFTEILLPLFIDLDFSHIHMINAYQLEMHTTRNSRGKRQVPEFNLARYRSNLSPHKD